MPHRAIIQFHVLRRNNVFRNNNNEIRYPLIHMRDHLFHVAFVRVALIYSNLFSERARKVIEFLILTSSFLSLVLLSYIHLAFVQSPTNCLEHIQDEWPRDGILRIEIMQEKISGKYTLEKSYLRERKIKEMEYMDLPYFFINYGFDDEDDEDYRYLMQMADVNNVEHNSSDSSVYTDSKASFNVSIDEDLNTRAEDVVLPTLVWTDDEYIMEFSLEYGFLKLSPSVRKQYNITVQLVTLDPSVDKCFGGALNNFILRNFLGYDEVLLASLKLLASREEYKGNKLSYVRNALSEVEFVFVNAWMDKKAYITAGFVMMVFTISISILLRYSHHQIFVFIVELLHMFEFQSSFNFPAGPLLTVILALVGMEAIMSEFFNDTAIAFYVILIVWMADQYDTICCKSPFTKKHWLRFFYLYHYFFYAYSHRFGHNRFLALLTSWLFTLHSMVYFFHRYELPILTSQAHRRNSDNHPSHPRSNEGTSSNPSTPANQSDSTITSNAPDLSNDNTTTENANPNNSTTTENANLNNSTLTQPVNQHPVCVTVSEDKELSATFNNKASHVSKKCDKVLCHMHSRHMVPKLKCYLKPKTKINMNVLMKHIKTILIYLKSYLIVILALLLFSRSLYSILSTCLTKLYSFDRIVRYS